MRKEFLPRLPKDYSRELRAIIWQCTNKKADSRPTAKEILKYEYLAESDDAQRSEFHELIRPMDIHVSLFEKDYVHEKSNSSKKSSSEFGSKEFTLIATGNTNIASKDEFSGQA